MPKPKAREKGTADKEQDHRVTQLEEELRRTRLKLQTSIEEYQSAIEEQKSTSEELQSSNEEPETSKEELQSINEELITVNGKLETKIQRAMPYRSNGNTIGGVVSLLTT